MKRNIFFMIIAFTAMQSLWAQHRDTDKKAWLDFQVGQHIGLNKWSDVSYANAGFPAASLTEFRGVLNMYLAHPVIGAFIEMGVGIMPAPDMKSFDVDRMPMPNSGTKYYLREIISESGPDGKSAHFKVGTGLFGDFRMTDKLSIMPYLGIGGLAMTRRSYELVLKEEGSNMQYSATYIWDKNDDEDPDSKTHMEGYLSARLNLRYKTNANLSVLFGLEYTYFFDTYNFYSKYSNLYNGNIQKAVKVNGNHMNMLGVTVGVSFR